MSQTRPPIALQLYTLRDLTQTDMKTMLREVAQIGYEGIEPAGYGNLSIQEFAAAKDELGLKVVSNHTGFSALQDDFQSVVEDNRALGNSYIVCPSIPGEMRSSMEGYKQFAQSLNEIGAKLRGEGMQLCYHNHAFEFEDRFDKGIEDGTFGLDVLYENSDPDLVQAELDTYWVRKGGVDPAAYLHKLKGRVPLLHIKDMADDANGSFAEVGNGILDWPGIWAAAEAAGVRAYIVEQDVCPGNPLDSIRLSLENLRKMGRMNDS